MNDRFSEELFLTNETGKMLYHKYAEHMPIIDYHSHLQQGEIASRKTFRNIAELWLAGDHYKWRLMRTAGVAEEFITGERSDQEKFRAFCKVLRSCDMGEAACEPGVTTAV